VLKFNLKKSLSCLATLGLFVRPCLAVEPSQRSTEAATNSMSHAGQSFRQWQQGNIVSAIGEGEKAVRDNPDSPVALINLALMKQRATAYLEAISLYWRALQLMPDSWVPPLGIARCYILNGDESDGRQILDVMTEQKDRDFNWYYMTAKTWLEIDELPKAQSATEHAITLATQPEQKKAAEDLEFLVLLREGANDRAKTMQARVLANNSPHDPELFVRSAIALLEPNEPLEGEKLLSHAIENLTDSDTFLRLGSVFQGKADDCKSDQSNRSLWLNDAQAAYAHAIAIKPDSPDYHFAQASVYCSKGERSNAADELKKYSSYERNDILAPFLISKLVSSDRTVKDPVPVNFSLVTFNILGVTCSCHLSKLHGALRKIQGVAFISTPPQKPYTGSVLVDQSLTPTHEMLAACNDAALAAEVDPSGRPVNIKLELISEQPVSTVSEALRIAREIRFGSVLSFPKTYSDYLVRFQDVAPIMPPANHDTVTGVEAAATWNAPL
jgi:tetratricopeptide (TPR) repeat protein